MTEAFVAYMVFLLAGSLVGAFGGYFIAKWLSRYIAGEYGE